MYKLGKSVVHPDSLNPKTDFDPSKENHFNRMVDPHWFQYGSGSTFTSRCLSGSRSRETKECGSGHGSMVRLRSSQKEHFLKKKYNTQRFTLPIILADPEISSRIQLFSILDPGSELSPSRIPDPQRIKVFQPPKSKKMVSKL